VALGLLAKLGIQADLAEDGVEAIRASEETAYDVVLMDCQMPRMDGFQAAREMRARETSGFRKSIIALTAGAFLEDRERCRDAGMDDFLTKPIDLQKLAAALDKWSPHRR
jgi:CheY-like chemotaxis protein